MGIVAFLALGSCNKDHSGTKGPQEPTQNFCLVDIDPNYTADEVTFDVKVFFTMPISDEDAMKIFDADFVKQYNVTTTYLGDRRYNFQLNNIARKNSDTNIEMKLDGKPLKSKSKATRNLYVCAKNEFKAIDVKVDKENSAATVIFSQPLKQRNIEGYVSVYPQMGYRSEIVGNKLVFYFDKSNLYRYQLEDVELTIGSGIKDIDGNSLGEQQQFTLDLTDLQPRIRWT